MAAILFVGGGLLGAGELKDLALVLFVGMLSGTYSSIFIATPVLADLKEREPKMKQLAARAAARAASPRSASKAARAVLVAQPPIMVGERAVQPNWRIVWRERWHRQVRKLGRIRQRNQQLYGILHADH